MEDVLEDTADYSQDHQSQEISAQDVFIAPSVHSRSIASGKSYSHFSDIPDVLRQDMSTECVLGVDEAGRGPVLGTPSMHHHLPTMRTSGKASSI